MRLLKAQTHRRMPWKNGGGETVEIAVHPPGADLADFDWRVSMAHVAGDGPFSVFPGIDRTLCLLAGEGLEFDIAGHGRHRLTMASEPLAFPADAPTAARLVGGPITDLNVMTRRGACRHRVARIAVKEHAVLDRSGRWNVLFVAGRCRIEANGFSAEMNANDALVGEGPLALAASAPDGPATIYAIEIVESF